MAAAASEEALRQAGLDRGELARVRAGVCLGTTMGEIRVLERHLEAEEAGVEPDGTSLPTTPATVSPAEWPPSTACAGR